MLTFLFLLISGAKEPAGCHGENGFNFAVLTGEDEDKAADDQDHGSDFIR